MCPSLNEVGEFNSLNEYACLRERESVCMLEGQRKRERELVSVCVSQCVYVCVSVSVCVCVSRVDTLYNCVRVC